MSAAVQLRHFADRCRKIADTERDPRVRSKLLEMAADYDRKAEQLG